MNAYTSGPLQRLAVKRSMNISVTNRDLLPVNNYSDIQTPIIPKSALFTQNNWTQNSL